MIKATMMDQKRGLTDSVSCPTMEIPGRRITYRIPEQKKNRFKPPSNFVLVTFPRRRCNCGSHLSKFNRTSFGCSLSPLHLNCYVQASTVTSNCQFSFLPSRFFCFFFFLFFWGGGGGDFFLIAPFPNHCLFLLS